MKENLEVFYGDNLGSELTLNPQKGCKNLFLFAITKTSKDLTANLEIPEDTDIEIAFADFGLGKANITFNVKMPFSHSSLHYHGAFLSDKKSHKDVNVNVDHLVGSNEALVENYGIALEASDLLFKGASHIHKGAKKAKTKQVAKIIVFDKDCFVSASPSLLIDENDVEASHAAIEGRLNDEHLFYLKSRGLKEKEAKMLITLGYLKPILSYFKEEDASLLLDEISSRNLYA